MPRNTKETNNKKETLKERLVSIKNAIQSKESEITSTKKALKTSTDTKKDTTKNKSTTKKTTNTNKVKSDTKGTSTKAKTSTTTIKKKIEKKSNSSTSKRPTKTQSIISKQKASSFTPEYYDLPYKYNQTVVKILAQTPTNLFIYWEISDEDRKNLKNTYGEYFFEITKPVLIIYNITMNYSFEIDINDFANSWYLQVNDSDCEYKIELGRRPIPINYNYIPQYDINKYGPIKPVKNNYIYISSSNELKAPNNRILFNKQNKIYFRNVKTNQIIEKNIKDYPFINENNKFINIYEFYKTLYKEEISNDIIDLKNPSSGNPSSGSFSSKFK